MQIRRVVYITFFLLIAPYVSSQKQSVIQTVDSLNEESFNLGSSLPDSAHSLGMMALNLAKNSVYTEGEMTALYRIGRAYFKKGDFTSALSWYNRSEQCFLKNSLDSIFLAKTYIYQGLALFRLGKLEQAHAKYDQSYMIALRRKDYSLLGQNLINISSLLIEQAKFTEALKFLHQALSHFPKSETENLGKIHLNIGNIYESQGRLDDALREFRKSQSLFVESKNLFSESKSVLSIGNIYMRKYQLDKANRFFRYALNLAEKNDFEGIEGVIYYNLGELYFQRKSIDSAEFFFDKSLTIKKESLSTTHQSLIYERLGDICLLNLEPIKALDNYLVSYDLTKNYSDQIQLANITEKLAGSYIQIGDKDQAFYFSELSGQYKDSIRNQMMNSLIYEMQYKDEKNQNEKMESELTVRDLELNRQSTLIMFLVISSVLIILFLTVMLKLYIQRKRKILIEKENLLAKKEIEYLLTTQERIAINAMLDGQESERNRIAYELHDKFGTTLSVVKLYFKSIDEQINLLKQENIEQFQKANKLLDEACDDARKIAHDLSSGMLARMGLFRVVGQLKDKIIGSGKIKVVLSTFGTDDNLKRLNEVAIYRIIQELISNVLNYANASELSIQLNVFKEEKVFNLLVEDNGVGFDISKMSTNSGMGIRGIKARVEDMNGNIEIDSVINRGTSVSIDIPLYPPKKEV